MYRYFFFLLFLVSSDFSYAQDTLFHNGDTVTYKWKGKKSFKIASADVWTVDNLHNVYVTDGESIKKYDSTGNLKFQQSIKSYGQITQLAPVNAMKLIYFSQEQQNLCFLDNTLTATEDCVDLADYDIYNAEWIATSTRPELLWVYDNVNSTLKLISLNTIGSVNLEIVNVKGILDLNEVDQIFEVAQNLYVLDKSKGVFQLDFYGGLLNTWPTKGAICIAADKDRHLFRLRQDELLTQGLYTDVVGESAVFKLPTSGIIDFQVVGSSLYFRTSKSVHKYHLHFSN